MITYITPLISEFEVEVEFNSVGPHFKEIHICLHTDT